MASQVYYWNLRASMKSPYAKRMERLLSATGFADQVRQGDLAAIKIHFGEAGVTGYLRPVWLRAIVDHLSSAGAGPFLTDASTLYVGERGQAVAHAMVAAKHGFEPLVTGCPVLIADGLKGGYQRAVPVHGKHIEEAFIAGDIADADLFVSVNHVKGHELAGFGGALKNIGMGCASKQGKMHQHLTTGPSADREKCVGCGACVATCAAGALRLTPDENGAERISVDQEKCVGCGGCFLACKTGALYIDWKTDVQAFLERMMEYCAGVLATKERTSLHINFVTDVVPDCDCVGFTDAPLCPDLGVLVSLDPVAVDQASVDLVAAAPALAGSKLPAGYKPGTCKFAALHSHVPADLGLAYAEEIGLGSRKYELVKV